MNMDYDPYDALLHHVYQQVSCSLTPFKPNLLLTSFHLIRLKAKPGSVLRKNPSRQVSVFGSRQDITVSFRITSYYWLHLKLPSDSLIRS